MIWAKFRRISSQHDDFPDEQRYHREGPWKLYKWNLGHSPKTLRSLLGNPNQVFFNNEDWFDHLCKVSSDFMTIFRLSKIQAHKRGGKMWEAQANSRNLSAVYHQWSKLSLFIESKWFEDFCAKFWRISIEYDDFPDEQRYHREGPWKLYKWNLGHSPKAPRSVLGNPKQVFSITKADSIICANFQVIS